MVQHALHGIHLEQVAHVLHHAGQTLVVALAVGVELAEHEVPDLHITVAVAALSLIHI